MKFTSRFLYIVAAFTVASSLVPVCRGQVQTSVTQIIPVPDGGQFYVDGQYFNHATSVVWPTGSQHTLSAVPDGTVAAGTQYIFTGWQWSNGSLSGNPIVVTADPSIKQYQAMFSVEFSFNLSFYPCASAPCSGGPGTVLVNGAPYTSDAQLYFGAGTSVVLQAQPAPGYVFAGWGPGISQNIVGFQNTVTVNSPVTVYPIFKPARLITLATVPAGLELLADQALVTGPVTLTWGYDTVHNLAPVSPQNDQQGNPWVFSSWSNNGANIQSYTVADSPQPDTVTATFVAGAPIGVYTVPQGLSVTVDGRSNWSSWNFIWGVGQSHTLAAPAQQTDAQGRVWTFSNWSDGGAASHSYTVPQSIAGSGTHLVATYTQSGHLTVTSALAGLTVSVDGSTCTVPCDVVRPLGTSVTVSAPPSVPMGTGSREDFLAWSNGAPGSIFTLSLGTDPVTLSANYHLMNLLATASAPAQAASWSLAPSSPDGYYDSQTNVTVSVAPLPGYRFHAWSGDLSGVTPTGTLAMAAPRAVQALFDKVPYIAPSGAMNAAGGTPAAAVAPGSIVSIFGANMAGNTALGASAPLTQTLAGTTVRVGDQLVPLFFVSPTQINLQLPSEVTTGNQTVTVSSAGQPDVQTALTVAQDAPGLFQSISNGQSFAVAVHADGSAVTVSSPAQAGETITVYGTGFGSTVPARPDGFAVPASPAYVLQDPIAATIASENVSPGSAVALAGSIGVDAVQVTVPADAPSGSNVQVTVTVGGQQSNMVLLPIQ